MEQFKVLEINKKFVFIEGIIAYFEMDSDMDFSFLLESLFVYFEQTGKMAYERAGWHRTESLKTILYPLSNSLGPLRIQEMEDLNLPLHNRANLL